MVNPVKKVPIHLQSAQNRLIIKNGTVVNGDGEQQVDVYVEVGLLRDFILLEQFGIYIHQKQKKFTAQTFAPGGLLCNM